MGKKISLELDVEDMNLVQGILDNFANYRVYSSMSMVNRHKAQKLADEMNKKIVESDFSDHAQGQAVS